MAIVRAKEDHLQTTLMLEQGGPQGQEIQMRVREVQVQAVQAAQAREAVVRVQAAIDL